MLAAGTSEIVAPIQKVVNATKRDDEELQRTGDSYHSSEAESDDVLLLFEGREDNALPQSMASMSIEHKKDDSGNDSEDEISKKDSSSLLSDWEMSKILPNMMSTRSTENRNTASNARCQATT
jgi:hypothetical protein